MVRTWFARSIRLRQEVCFLHCNIAQNTIVIFDVEFGFNGFLGLGLVFSFLTF